MYYFYRKSNRGHGICPLYTGCPPFGESVIRAFTVLYPGPFPCQPNKPGAVSEITRPMFSNLGSMQWI